MKWFEDVFLDLISLGVVTENVREFPLLQLVQLVCKHQGDGQQ
jgi:hypothetical protein